MKNVSETELNLALLRLRQAVDGILVKKQAAEKRSLEVESAAAEVLKKLDKMILDSETEEEGV